MGGDNLGHDYKLCQRCRKPLKPDRVTMCGDCYVDVALPYFWSEFDKWWKAKQLDLDL